MVPFSIGEEKMWKDLDGIKKKGGRNVSDLTQDILNCEQ